MNLKPVYIYALVDPRDYATRYVGSSVNPQQRLVSHMRDKFGRRKAEWIAELKSIGLKPKLKVLEKITSGAHDEAEAKWIQHFKHKGMVLTNSEFTHESNHLKVTKEIDWTERKQSLLNDVVALLKADGTIPKDATSHIADSLAVLHAIEALRYTLISRGNKRTA